MDPGVITVVIGGFFDDRNGIIDGFLTTNLYETTGGTHFLVRSVMNRYPGIPRIDCIIKDPR